jgi:hypothetical protein
MKKMSPCIWCSSKNYFVKFLFQLHVSQLGNFDKIPEINNLKRGKIYFESQFQRFQFIVVWSHCSGPMARQYIMVGLTWWGTAAHLMVWPLILEGETVTSFLQRAPPPKFLLPPNIPWSYESISGSICWWSQSSQDPIIFQRPYLWALLHWRPSLQ